MNAKSLRQKIEDDGYCFETDDAETIQAAIINLLNAPVKWTSVKDEKLRKLILAYQLSLKEIVREIRSAKRKKCFCHNSYGERVA
jgi:glycosyltransferase involved in cell wall biosynthesis